MLVYHGGYCVIEKPEIRISKNKKDFGHGFYCTELQEQADTKGRSGMIRPL